MAMKRSDSVLKTELQFARHNYEREIKWNKKNQPVVDTHVMRLYGLAVLGVVGRSEL